MRDHVCCSTFVLTHALPHAALVVLTVQSAVITVYSSVITVYSAAITVYSAAIPVYSAAITVYSGPRAALAQW
jgi:hypothetical protein